VAERSVKSVIASSSGLKSGQTTTNARKVLGETNSVAKAIELEEGVSQR